MTCTSEHKTVHEHLYVQSVEVGARPSGHWIAKIKAHTHGPDKPREATDWQISLFYMVDVVADAPKAGDRVCVEIRNSVLNSCPYLPQATEQAPPANTTEGDLAEKRAILFPADFE